MVERKQNLFPHRKQTFLAIALLVTSLSFPGGACSIQNCAAAESHTMANCGGMEMPLQLGANRLSDMESSCCHVSQATPTKLWQSPETQIREKFVSFTTFDDMAGSWNQEQRLISSAVTPSPPELQSLLCTLLI